MSRHVTCDCQALYNLQNLSVTLSILLSYFPPCWLSTFRPLYLPLPGFKLNLRVLALNLPESQSTLCIAHDSSAYFFVDRANYQKPLSPTMAPEETVYKELILGSKHGQ
jgi:hypothetical protein